jgi:hypothetical protein
MFRVRLIVTAAAIAIAPALAGCSGSSVSTYLPDWLQFKPPPPPTQVLQFETAPPGADVRTTQDQTCLTPCSLAVPVSAQSVTFALNGYAPQTVQVEVGQSGDLIPNPVEAALQPLAPPPKPIRRPPRRRPPPRTAARRPPPPPPEQPAIAAPEQAPPAAAAPQESPFPPPSASPFPPPPPPQGQTQ